MSPPNPPPAEAASVVTRPLWLATITYVLYWLQLLGHEAGHSIGRILFTGDADLTKRWPLRVQIATFGGGPLFTFALMGVAVAVAMRARSARVRMIAVIAGIAAASRTVSIVPLIVAGMPTDERALSQLLGVPYLLIGGIELVLTVVVVRALVVAIPPNTRRGTLTWIVLAIIVAFITAMTFGKALGIPVGKIGG